ncbi:MAG: threonine--tRNA ligase, partial [Spirochaetales bacterium]|nr:threonine--tRNA ligase [Spirochaetales bacterium]
MEMDVNKLRHSAAHVLAEAVSHLYPGTQFGIGPAIDDGFYYDFLLPKPITMEDLPAIEKEMRRIISGGYTFTRKELSKEEAKKLFTGQDFKLELIDGLEEGSISVYEQDGFVDLCQGPHLENTRQIRPDC